MNTRMHRSLTAAVAATALLLASTSTRAADSDLQRQLMAAEESNDYPAVAEICRRLVEADAGNLEALRKLVRTRLALGDIENARRSLADLKEAAGVDDADVLEIEGDLLARDDKNDEAVVKWQAALKADGENAALLAKLGYHFLNTRENSENAAYYFERLLALRAQARDHLIVAEAAAMRRDWNTVIARTAALKSDFASDSSAKRKVPGLERLIDALMRITLLDKRIEAADASVSDILERGLLFRELGFPEIGLIDARRAVKMVPNALYVRLAYAIVGGPVWSEHERIKGWGINPNAFRSRMPAESFLEDLTGLETTLRETPSDGDALLRRAKLLLANSQRSLALVDLDAALASNPDDPQALHLKASLARDSGKYRRAVPLIERALALQADDPAILRTGISIFAAQGEYARAIALCDRFLALANHKDPKGRKEVSKQRILYYERIQQKAPAKP